MVVLLLLMGEEDREEVIVMCGINGIVARYKDKNKIIKDMNDKIIQRGPNAEGIYVDVTFGGKPTNRVGSKTAYFGIKCGALIAYL